MTELRERLARRWPQSWTGRALWLAIFIAAFWTAYNFASAYGSCRGKGWGEVACLFMAIGATWLNLLFLIIETVYDLLRALLP